ncbi:hypothetical protein VFPPC_16075 [Pochonia chlamydosporia 170]|uniref:Uncharacterized protein n=1 Tax=Pochonia chlamydosporia 170 TaxID=1380566 RepID=A0A179FMM4_METCM|nr:hypothetical protein VFPPC_16075 [Pochonia chlamydosporia 170]OAQ66895.1 hypothetical protein VFPPC_16075 [Pochonia chlamydosporia 170]
MAIPPASNKVLAPLLTSSTHRAWRTSGHAVNKQRFAGSFTLGFHLGQLRSSSTTHHFCSTECTGHLPPRAWKGRVFPKDLVAMGDRGAFVPETSRGSTCRYNTNTLAQAHNGSQ